MKRYVNVGLDISISNICSSILKDPPGSLRETLCKNRPLRYVFKLFSLRKSQLGLSVADRRTALICAYYFTRTFFNKKMN